MLLAYAVYFRCYHRRDLLLAYVALNLGVLAVTVLLAGAQAGIGLVNGLRPAPGWLAPGVSAVLVAIMYAVGHPRLGGRTHRQLVTLDVAYPTVPSCTGRCGGCSRPRCATWSSSRST